jgi:cell division protease FtsH
LNFLGVAPPRRSYSEETAREVDQAVRTIVDDAFARAQDLLSRNRATLEEGARILLARETLGEAELVSLFRKLRGPEAPGGSGGLQAAALGGARP